MALDAKGSYEQRRRAANRHALDTRRTACSRPAPGETGRRPSTREGARVIATIQAFLAGAGERLAAARFAT